MNHMLKDTVIKISISRSLFGLWLLYISFAQWCVWF